MDSIAGRSRREKFLHRNFQYFGKVEKRFVVTDQCDGVVVDAPCFPWQVLFTLLPTALVVPYVIQQSRNTWAGVIIHAGLNGSGFLMLGFGLA